MQVIEEHRRGISVMGQRPKLRSVDCAPFESLLFYLPSSGLQHLGLVHRTHSQSFHRTGYVFRYFK